MSQAAGKDFAKRTGMNRRARGRQSKRVEQGRSQSSNMAKYPLYEEAVQDPDQLIGLFEQAYRDQFGCLPASFKEDFCGTFLLSKEWVKRSTGNTAIGLDISEEPLRYGKKHHYRPLTSDQKKRLSIHRQNVLEPSKQKVDLIAACNFSFYVFKQRQELVRYFKAAYRSLRSEGVFVLEMVGGPGFCEAPHKEQRSCYHPAETSAAKKGRKKKWFTYFWEHRDYNPVTHEGLYLIHFKLPDGTYYRDAFVYDWRVWTIPELREALIEAGFSNSLVYWEVEDEDGDGTGEFEQVEEADNDHTWIAYVVGVKQKYTRRQ